MELYQRRMLDERNKLATKIEKLNKFFSNEKFKNLSKEQQDLMARQLCAMKEYLFCLDERINLENFSGKFIESESKEAKLDALTEEIKNVAMSTD